MGGAAGDAAEFAEFHGIDVTEVSDEEVVETLVGKKEVNPDEKKRVGVAEDACAKTARGAEAEARQKSEDMLRLLAAVHAQPSVVRGAGPIKP